MSGLEFLEEFSANAGVPAQQNAESTQPAVDSRAAFDEGYNCGWQDGAASIECDVARQQQALAEAFQEVKFTYFEARQHILNSVRPVLEAMVDVALPKAMAPTLGAHVVDLLDGLASKVESTVVLTCAPESEAMLREVAEAEANFPITIETEATLTASQVVLHFDQGQSRIDLDGVLSAIRASIDDFYASPTKEAAAHG